MEIIEYYTLKKDVDGYILNIYIDPNSTEFASEILESTKEVAQDFNQWFLNWRKKQAPSLKIHAIKIIIGSIILTTISVPYYSENDTYAQTTNRFNMSYVYFGHPSTYTAKVHSTNNAMEVVSPSYFDLDESGNLALTWHLDTKFIKEMHNHNIKVVPFLSNHWNQKKGIAALENRDQLVLDIIEAIETYDLDGINVDIENVTHEQKEMYVDLVKQLREKLPAEKEVSVAVAANPSGWDKGWHGSYDYHELGKYADYLMIMAYDESYYGSEPGPVSSHSFVERSIQYALKHVPAEKIVLGIAFYGRYWNAEQGIAGNGIHLTKIQEMMNTYETEMIYNEKSQSAKAIITVKQGDPPVLVFGKVLVPGTYTIWYENNDSIKDKLRLVQKYNIKGTGNWSLGQETSDVWMYYELWLNGKYFEDIDHSWAKEDILEIVQKKIMKGVTETKFDPDQPLTRAQAATVMVRALQLEKLNEEKLTFKDVDTNHWARENINIVVQHGMMKGMGGDVFAPDEPLTREQMAMLLYRVLEQQSTVLDGEKPYSDIDTGRWSEAAIYSMSKRNVFKGYPDQTFRPTKAMLRQEMAAVLNRISNTDG